LAIAISPHLSEKLQSPEAGMPQGKPRETEAPFPPGHALLVH